MTTIEKMKMQKNESELNKWPRKVREENSQNHYLEDNTKYSKCFYCYDEKIKKGYTPEKLKDSKNLRYIKNKETYQNQDGTYFDTFNEFYKCEECGRILTVDDFVKRYCKINKNFN